MAQTCRDGFEAAAVSLHNLLTDLEEDPEAPVHRRLRLDDPELVEGLLQYNGGKLCLRALGFTEEEEESTYDGGGASLCLPEDAEGAAMEYQRAHDLTRRGDGRLPGSVGALCLLSSRSKQPGELCGVALGSAQAITGVETLELACPT